MVKQPEISFGSNTAAHPIKELTVFPPPVNANGKPVDYVRIKHQVAVVLARLFGNSSTSDRKWHFYSKSQNKADVASGVEVMSLVNEHDLDKNQGTVRSFLQSLMKEHELRSIALRYDGQMHTVNRIWSKQQLAEQHRIDWLEED